MTLTYRAAGELACQLMREGRLSECALRRLQVAQRDIVPVMAHAEAQFVNTVSRAWPARRGEYRGEWR